MINIRFGIDIPRMFIISLPPTIAQKHHKNIMDAGPAAPPGGVCRYPAQDG
jgi:hypothetical protein